MSVIAAKVYKDKIIMAGDSIIVKGDSKQTDLSFTKINKINDMIVGGCGIAEELSLLWIFMSTHKPAAATEKDVLEFFTEFSFWKSNITTSLVENSYLLAFQGHLFEIEEFFITEVKKHAAIGAGEDFANAALYLGHSPQEAVKTACALSCFVAEPIIEFEMNRKVEKS